MILELKTREEWLAVRKKVVTATEVPVLLGLNPFMSPNQLLKEKELSTFHGNAYTQIGEWLEPVVIQATNLTLGTDFRLLEENGAKKFFHLDGLKLGATPDAISADGTILLECKTTKPTSYIQYQMSPPDQYILQLTTQLHCATLKQGYLSILSTDLTQTSPQLDLRLSIYEVNCNQKLGALIEEEVDRFWACKEEGKDFKVNPQTKAHAKMLVDMCYKKIH